MKLTSYLLFSIGIMLACQPQKAKDAPSEEEATTEVSFFTSDSILIIGDWYAVDTSATTIILFHQARSNARGEYGTIVPELVEAGYNVLAVDQRSGGQTFGSYNRTVASRPWKNYTYCDAYEDFEAALNFVLNKSNTGKTAVWGSSYSAALVIQLAHKRPEDVDAVLAFSPASGGPMKECSPNDYLATLTTPLLLLRPEKEMEIESVQAQFDLAVENNHHTYIAKDGVHGSSMLVEGRAEGKIEDTWDAVKSFLKELDSK